MTSVSLQRIQDTADLAKKEFQRAAGADGRATRTDIRRLTGASPELAAFLMGRVEEGAQPGGALPVKTFNHWMDVFVADLNQGDRNGNGRVTGSEVRYVEGKAPRELWALAGE